ncbi:hypothetical protein ACIRPT_27410, partial [Streptomyces sp. NPDC101227]
RFFATRRKDAPPKARRPAPGCLHDLRDRLAGAEWWDDQDFGDYGLSPEQVEDLRAWALAWAGHLDTRLYTGEDDD